MLLEKVAEKGEIVWRLLGVVADLEVPASIVRWKSQPVGQRSSSWGGGEDLSSAQRDGSQRRRSQASQCAWEFSGGAGSRRFLGCGRCGVGEGEVVSRDVDGLRGAGVCWCAGAESQEDVGEGKGMVKEGGAGRGGKERWKWLSTCPVWSR